MAKQDKTEIRVAVPDDRDAIYRLVATAYGRSDEAELVYRLRAYNDIVLELVSVGGLVNGHIAFSRLHVEPQTMRLAGLQPLSVMPGLQGNGVGSALVREGLTRCAAMGFDAVAVLGDPTYYKSFGFSRKAARALTCVYSGLAYQALELRPGALAGAWQVKYPRAFD
ncbi:MAG TPA: N-acetyltransferase [Rhizomicrobium sp.]|jgi:putative acetyltransferase|nr:N-acetyltransferase [Rhizomicrobium sp.]